MTRRGECEKGPYEIACDGLFEGEGIKVRENRWQKHIVAREG